MKYADPNLYEIETRRDLRQAARELMKSESVAPSKAIVDLLDEEPLEVEIATTLLYEHCHYSYRQVRQALQVSGELFRAKLSTLGLRHRGKYDEMLRGFRAGQQFRFDILMDTGGFRDMHRHRRCIQVMQGSPPSTATRCCSILEDAGARARFDAVMRRTQWQLRSSCSQRQYTKQKKIRSTRSRWPIKKRALFKMDFAEAVYISELRTTRRDMFPTVMSLTRCMRLWHGSIRRWPSISAYTM